MRNAKNTIAYPAATVTVSNDLVWRLETPQADASAQASDWDQVDTTVSAITQAQLDALRNA
jgi:hypothetical protein